MAGNIADDAERTMLDWVNVVGNPTRPTAPLRVRLMVILGTDSSPGTEVSGGSYAPQVVTFTAASGGSAYNTSALDFTNMPAVTVRGVEVWDSTPIRLWHGPLVVDRPVGAGDVFRLRQGDIVTSLD